MKKIFLLMLLCLLANIGMNAQGELKTSKQMEYNRLSTLYLNLRGENNDSALQVAFEMERLANELNQDVLRVPALAAKAGSYGAAGLTDLSTAEAYKMARLAEASGNTGGQADAYYMIAQNYYIQGDYENSILYYRKANEKLAQIGAAYDSLANSYNMGLCYMDMKQYDKAIAVIRKALDAEKKTDDRMYVPMGLNALSKALQKAGRPEEALQVQLEAFNYPDLIVSNDEHFFIYAQLADLYLDLKQYAKAQQAADSLGTYALLLNTTSERSDQYELQSKISEATGDFKTALLNKNRFMALQDSMRSRDYNQKIAAMHILYDVENKQAAIARLEDENRIKQIQRNWILTAGVALILIVIVILGYRNQRQKRKMQVSFSRQLLQEQENEKQRISKELHDSVGQNILFVKTQLKQHPQAEELKNVLTAIDSTIEEVRTISKDLYPNQLEKYGLAEAVETLGEKVKESTGIFVSADFGGLEQKLSKEEAINFYRIIQECINNSIKHSEAKSIRITAEEKNKQIVLLIQDNGKGFDSSLLRGKAGSSFGMLNMEERIRLLNGHFAIESAIGKGTKLCFTIPVS
jgi:signal transduction histidine kinase